TETLSLPQTLRLLLLRTPLRFCCLCLGCHGHDITTQVHEDTDESLKGRGGCEMDSEPGLAQSLKAGVFCRCRRPNCEFLERTAGACRLNGVYYRLCCR
uniref:Mammalian defensins domain-containing protein n=1 Tax=Sciurus vulgaris TaxID=55149 RepID=A0A8D2CMT5_SCIVU